MIALYDKVRQILFPLLVVSIVASLWVVAEARALEEDVEHGLPPVSLLRKLTVPEPIDCCGPDSAADSNRADSNRKAEGNIDLDNPVSADSATSSITP